MLNYLDVFFQLSDRIPNNSYNFDQRWLEEAVIIQSKSFVDLSAVWEIINMIGQDLGKPVGGEIKIYIKKKRVY